MNKVVFLTISRQRVLYDVENLCYVEGDIMKAEDEHARHQVLDVAQDGNVDRATRVMDMAFSRCVEMCFPYSKVPVTEAGVARPVGERVTYGTNVETSDTRDGIAVEEDDIFNETANYIMKLMVPEEMSLTTLNLLAKYVHEFMVASVLADWLSITKPASQEKWERKMEDAASQISKTIMFRCGRVRRTQTPF